MQERFNRILSGVEAKRSAELRHNLYTGYLIQEESESREILLKAYLSEAGIEE